MPLSRGVQFMLPNKWQGYVCLAWSLHRAFVVWPGRWGNNEQSGHPLDELLEPDMLKWKIICPHFCILDHDEIIKINIVCTLVNTGG